MNELQQFTCENGHSTKVYSSDPYYPDWVECQKCGERMHSDGLVRD